MSIHFHPLTIKKIKKETVDCVSIEFDIPTSLQKSFSYVHGQSLTLRTIINGEEVRRTYSLCSSPLDHEWKVAVKKNEGGLFSTFANDKLKSGDQLDVMEPVGKFYTDLHPSNKKNYLAFACGSGITPVLSIIKTTGTVYNTVAIIPKYTLKLVCSSQSHFLSRSELITPFPKPIPKEYNELTQNVVRIVSTSKLP